MKLTIAAIAATVFATSAFADLDRDIAYQSFVNDNIEAAYTCVEDTIAGVDAKYGERMTARIAEETWDFTRHFDMQIDVVTNFLMQSKSLLPADAKEFATTLRNCVVY